MTSRYYGLIFRRAPQGAEDRVHIRCASDVALDIDGAARLDGHVEQRRSLVLAMPVDRGVARDPVQERDERQTLIAVAHKGLHRLQEHVADQVLGFVGRGGTSEAAAIGRWARGYVDS